MPNRTTLLCFVCIATLSCTVVAQTTSNPDISVIPRIHVRSGDEETGSLSDPDLTLEELEIAFQAYLNPFAKADVYLAKHGTDDTPFELEEVYATFLRGLPFDLNARIGKFRAEFGKFNTIHPHAWPFVTRPLLVERFLGDEGANDLGLGLSMILPTGDLYSRLSFEVLRGGFTQTIDPRQIADDASIGHYGHLHTGVIGLLDTLGLLPAFAFTSRMMTFLPVSDESDMEIGFSAMSGVHDPYRDLRFLYTNVDIKYKWKPSAYTSFTLQAEALMNTRRIAATGEAGESLTKDLTTYGLFAFGEYQFEKSFTIGARYDWAQSPYSADDKSQGFALFAGFYPVEETSAFRLEYAHAKRIFPEGDASTIRSITLQFLFSLGPHKAHPF